MRLSRNNSLLLTMCVIFFFVAFLFKIPADYHFDHNQLTSCNVLTNRGFGTGTFVNNKAYPYVLTCKHVVQDASLQVDIGHPIKNEIVKGKVVLTSKSKDLAIIELDNNLQNTNIAKYAINSNEKLGDRIYYFGLPGVTGPTFLHSGFLSKKDLKTKVGTFDVAYINVLQGSSGSTVFNTKGLGIGIVCRGNMVYQSPERTDGIITGGNLALYLKIDDIRAQINRSNLPILDGILDGRCNCKLSEMHCGPIEIE